MNSVVYAQGNDVPASSYPVHLNHHEKKQVFYQWEKRVLVETNDLLSDNGKDE